MIASESTVRVAIVVLSTIGIAIAGYLTVTEFMGEVPVCAAGGGSGCATVANSSYSHLLGIPVSVFGLAGYVGILASALIPGESGRLGGFLLSLVGVGFSGYLTYLELFVIDAICQWCVASAVVMALLLILCVLRLLTPDAIGSRDAMS
ncbi:MAG: vitamin K epoxide reductase family protein [Solirubrobacterales bacterium]